MKKNSKSDNKILPIGYRVAVVFLLCFATFFSACSTPEPDEHNHAANKEEIIYYCPMHPEVQQNTPGVCDKCNGMELVVKEPEGLTASVVDPANTVALSTVHTLRPRDTIIPIMVEGQGYVDYDDRTRHSISSRLEGRIEKLYLKYNFQTVHKGQRVFDIYSPELLTAQQNMVYLLNNDPNATDLLAAARQKLEILGMSKAAIKELTVTHKTQNSVAVYSAWSGRVTDKKHNNISGNNSPATTPELSIKEGMYVARGQTVFNVIDPHKLSVYLQVKQEDISKIELNQKVTIDATSTGDSLAEGTVSFIEPIINDGNKTLLVRVDINNKNELIKVGTLVKGTISCEPVEGLWVPASAVRNLGKSKMVWVKSDNKFIATKIETGVITNDWIEIYDGITARNEIAEQAHYLTDSEGFIKTVENEE